MYQSSFLRFLNITAPATAAAPVASADHRPTELVSAVLGAVVTAPPEFATTDTDALPDPAVFCTVAEPIVVGTDTLFSACLPVSFPEDA